MLLGGLMLFSQLAQATRADRFSGDLARQAVDEAMDEVAAPAPVVQPSALMSKRIVPAGGMSVEEASDYLIDTIIQLESAGNPRRVGRSGERGLMQLRSRTWTHMTRELFGKKVPFDRAFEPELNRQVGRAYLAWLHKYLLKNKGKWKADERTLLLACYNAGPETVRRAGFAVKQLPASTRDYVKRASALHDDLMRQSQIHLASL
ncbi:MAG TPA: lytic transglycosylase domain-containing protein [Kiritimatiellia bacterium]|jgi:soluble lytic murein transglycosylase-like protein